ncbi:pyridoxal-phosphate dependent enzyme [Thalassotalea ponticola]|uniref:1-aminocyclopropane-1-carboxylate deaminase/D-cysteine desulfhydrase n=1 Tax=Thalassotalea ponticola TaxID=1523392 RepID=UPI0025B3D7AD|nr:pyridoxal-phosphate dependent enzyme [Thalassotalea ponticola]MDN3653497.1 pyridoxal-phosphate dependent enzyme [Thalassotalea ponticola]
MLTHSPLQPFTLEPFQRAGLRVFIKRDDLLHPIISGNKWRKLKYNIEQAKQRDVSKVISFGGAYSNHIHALAYACHLANLPSLGIIRGEQAYRDNYTLRWARHWQMQLQFVDRQTYRLREDGQFLKRISDQHPHSVIIPEGGSNKLAVAGVAEVVDELEQQCEFDYLLSPVGSGGTLAGLIEGAQNRYTLLGIAVLKQQDYLQQQVQSLLNDRASKWRNWHLLNQFHQGGYGKFGKQDAARLGQIIKQTGIPFEPVYTGKMVLAAIELAKQGYFAKGSTVVLLHTGGTQGLGGLLERQRITADDFIMPPPAPRL